MDIESIKAALSSPLSPKIKLDGENKLASVLIVIYGKDPTVLMTKKPKHLKIHAGEISFPGGKWTNDDNDLLETAIRETKEEINLQISREKITGQLEPISTLNSKFTITPFVCVLYDIPKLQANPEVEKILHIPLFSFLQTLEDDLNPEHKSIQEMYTFTYQDNLVWGASARMLKQILNQLNV